MDFNGMPMGFDNKILKTINLNLLNNSHFTYVKNNNKQNIIKISLLKYNQYV